MNKLTFYILDVFAEKRFAGNQLAVFREARDLPSKVMQQIAKEMNFSETTFILSDAKRDNGYDVRIFTPEEEVPFAGHPTLGTSYVIQQEIEKTPIKQLNLNLAVGKIPVSFEYKDDIPEILWMTQIQPTFGWTLDAETLAQVLNINSSEIDERFPIQEVSTGLSFIIVPLKNLETIRNIKINLEKYFNLVEHTQAKAVFVFCPETYNKGNDLNARMFAEYLGVFEDPATGSANGCLAAYLLQNQYYGSDSINIRVEQGYEIHRPSLLYLKASKTDDKFELEVGGKVILVAKGEMNL